MSVLKIETPKVLADAGVPLDALEGVTFSVSRSGNGKLHAATRCWSNGQARIARRKPFAASIVASSDLCQCAKGVYVDVTGPAGSVEAIKLLVDITVLAGRVQKRLGRKDVTSDYRQTQSVAFGRIRRRLNKLNPATPSSLKAQVLLQAEMVAAVFDDLMKLETSAAARAGALAWLEKLATGNQSPAASLTWVAVGCPQSFELVGRAKKTFTELACVGVGEKVATVIPFWAYTALLCSPAKFSTGSLLASPIVVPEGVIKDGMEAVVEFATPALEQWALGQWTFDQACENVGRAIETENAAQPIDRAPLEAQVFGMALGAL